MHAAFNKRNHEAYRVKEKGARGTAHLCWHHCWQQLQLEPRFLDVHLGEDALGIRHMLHVVVPPHNVLVAPQLR